jgi:ubiquinone/menaquinone biosynthesis C-methylase UbiE
MRRVPTTELLDIGAGTREEIAASLDDLQRVNRWFGGIATTNSLVEQFSRATGMRQLSLLEVAAGSGFVPDQVRRRCARKGTDLKVAILDRSPSHLRVRSLPTVAGDALTLPFRDASFDLVSCSLFLHHLAPEKAIEFVNEALRVCRRAVLINDLVRSRLHLTLVYAGFPLYRSRITRHDAPASVRQAYTPQEVRQLLGRTHASRIEISRHYLCRMGITAWKD